MPSKKSKKSSKIWVLKKVEKIGQNFWTIFQDFFVVLGFSCHQIFYKQKTSFFGQARPFGARWAGPPLLFLGWKYWKSSQEKVSRKTTLYFLEKSSFLVILPIKMLWFVSRTTDLVERIREQFFFIQNWLEIVRVMTFFLVSQKVAKMIHFFASISPFPMKNPVLPNF